ncbi:porin family protein [Rickettsiella endosymbiont of Dermanyssus gallinae]|uniref:porin family protein n=1 Tax=Rickettsiella endosymbiont of Dermanyssus gallinae TaxID=2856608 RepID=UPI001C52AA99|nr:outer membrane beta-barrel protein [Rickettsiella endosymbiont of Dermanyssus gallinae]
MLKKVITTAVLAVSALSVMTANAAAPGPYITGQLGYADTHMGPKTNVDKLSNNGIAGRLAVGYQLNQNLAVEAGYLQLRSKKVNTDLNPKLSQHAIDLAAKGILPIANNLNVYGKVGVAYLTTTVKSDDDSVSAVNKYKWAPEAAVGVSYDITPNVSVDTSWTHIQPIGGKNRPGNIDFVAVGVGYNFG